MLLIADAIRRYDLSSLKIITYGTEPMPPSTLAAVREALPWVQSKQTYGLSEIGILSTRHVLRLGVAEAERGGFEHQITTVCFGLGRRVQCSAI